MADPKGIPIHTLNPALEAAVRRVMATGTRTAQADGTVRYEAEGDAEYCPQCGRPAPGPDDACGREGGGCPYDGRRNGDGNPAA